MGYFTLLEVKRRDARRESTDRGDGAEFEPEQRLDRLCDLFFLVVDRARRSKTGAFFEACIYWARRRVACEHRLGMAVIIEYVRNQEISEGLGSS